MLKKYKGVITFTVIFLILVVVIYLTRPATDTLGSYSANLDGLNKAQRKNICLAARKLNGSSINPGYDFSFNSKVGPRTLENGFVPAGVIFEGEMADSPGGGLCLLSSSVYNAALRANLKIITRVAHTTTIRSVPPGLDATVWYGVNDLVFKNTTVSRIKLQAECSYNRLNINITGKNGSENPSIIMEKKKVSSNRLQVCVYRKSNNIIEKISEDIYSLK